MRRCAGAIVREKPLDQAFVGSQQRLAGSGQSLLELPDDLPEQIAGRPTRMRALSVIERQPHQSRVEVHLPFGNERERSQPRDESGLGDAVRRHPYESIEVPPNQVHEDRLGEVIEIEPEDQRLRASVARPAVQELTAPDAAERAGNGPGQPGSGAIRGRSELLLGTNGPMGDPEALGQLPGRAQRRRTVSGHPLVDAERDQTDGRAATKIIVRERQCDRGILSAGQCHRDRSAAEVRQLSTKFVPNPLLDGGREVSPAEMATAIRLIDDGIRVARGAPHDPGNRDTLFEQGAPRAIPLRAYDY